MFLTQQMQEALLHLLEVPEISELEDYLRSCFHIALPNYVDSVVYVLSSEGDVRDLVSSRGVTHILPKEGVLFETVEKRKRHIVPSLKPTDPTSSLLTMGNQQLVEHQSKGLLCCRLSQSSPSGNQKYYVVCSPIVDNHVDEVIAVYSIACGQLSDDELEFLVHLEKQFLCCYHNFIKNPYRMGRSRKDDDILSLCADLHDRDATSSQRKIVQYVAKQTHAETGFILLLDQERQELFCQVICDKTLAKEIRFPVLDNSFLLLVEKKTSVSLDSIDPGHLEELKKYIPMKLSSSLCVPIMCKSSGHLLAIVCVVNKKDGKRFTETDEDLIKNCLLYTAPVIHSSIAIQNERIVRSQTQVLLQVAKNLFTHLGDLAQLLSEIMQEARKLTQAERCSVFLLDKERNELVAKIFDGQKNSENPKEVRIPASMGIAGYVATTGEMLNIDDAYTHRLFYKGIDEATGFKTKSLLCFPIKDDKGDVIGVAQLCNKLNGLKFTSFDENIAQAFSVYCCISIMHSLLYKKATDSQHRSKLSNELMIYHMQVAGEDVNALASSATVKPEHLLQDYCKFSCIPRNVPSEKLPLAVLSMFEDLNFINRFRIRIDSLARFILMVRKGYRDPPYHNWSHAFAVLHFCYLLYKNTKVLTLISDLDAFSLFVSCLCHDIDHRGTTNSFQVASGSVLAALYSSEGSVLERHHFAQTLCILNTDGCNIFENLTPKEYKEALDLVQHIILATDLAQHLRKLKDIDLTVHNYKASEQKHRQLLLSLLMTSCDLSDQTKNFENSKSIAERIYQEFFSQGDLEREIGCDPQDMMDRDKAIIPDLQISFLDSIAIPVYSLLAVILPETKEVLEAAENNCKRWNSLNEKLIALNLPRNMTIFQNRFDDADDDADDTVL